MDLKLSDLMNGGLEEKVNRELTKVIENVLDPNTEATKAREINIKIKIVPWEDRSKCNMNAEVKSKLQPGKKIDTIIYVGETANGFEAAEAGSSNPYQRKFDVETGEITDDPALEKVRKFNRPNVVGEN